jgi:glycolate oxidase FAD binding subunit
MGSEGAVTVSDVREIVRQAIATRQPLRIAGAGTWLAAGRPVRYGANPLSVAQLSGIVEYTPGDLTLTARAGTALGEIDVATRPQGQWLALDPFGGESGTIGATIATASVGPLAHAFGHPRDVTVGIEFVTGGGETVRAGGRVVKNVAGFDLTRLVTGAWGTLGVITEVTVRLRARPETDETVAVAVPDARNAASLARWLAGEPFPALTASAFELLNVPLARHLALPGSDAVLLIRLTGNGELVRAQRAALDAAGDTASVPPDVWYWLRACEPTDAAVVRFSSAATRIAETWAYASAITAHFPRAFVHASPGRGIVRCIFPEPDPMALATAFARHRFAGTTVAERLPGALWGTVARSAVADKLSRGVKRAYDPYGLFNPGILGETPSQ